MTDKEQTSPSAGAKPRMCHNHPDEPAAEGEPFCEGCLLEDYADDLDDGEA